MSNISKTFERLRREGKRALIPFITAGDPDLAATRALLIELAKSGADIIELGVPFSDPVADGPVIQRASMRALRNEVGIADILRLVQGVRSEVSTPIVLFSYFNPLLQFGLKHLVREMTTAGIDGVLVTDLAIEEAQDFRHSLVTEKLDLIMLVTPTTKDARLKMIVGQANGFIYAVSRAGVTGARKEMSDEAEKLVARVRAISDLPVAVGFGVSSRQQVAEVWKYADGAVVGSAIVAEIERLGDVPELVGRVGDFVRDLRPVGS